MAKTIGRVLQFGNKGYGFIVDDAGVKYFVHQKNTYNKSRLKVKSRVIFDIEDSDKGPVAVNVKLYKNKTNNNTGIKLFLVLSYLIHAWLIYEIFIKTTT